MSYGSKGSRVFGLVSLVMLILWLMPSSPKARMTGTASAPDMILALTPGHEDDEFHYFKQLQADHAASLLFSFSNPPLSLPVSLAA